MLDDIRQIGSTIKKETCAAYVDRYLSIDFISHSFLQPLLDRQRSGVWPPHTNQKLFRLRHMLQPFRNGGICEDLGDKHTVKFFQMFIVRF